MTRTRASDGSALPLELARDLYDGWGDFEDYTADRIADGETHWSLNDSTRRVEARADAPSGAAVLRARRVQSSSQDVVLSPVSRAPLLETRFYTESGGTFTATSDAARYSVRFTYRFEGQAPVELRLNLYTFLDPDPFLLPDATFLRDVTLSFTPQADGQWHEAVVDVPAAALAPDAQGNPPLFALPLLRLGPSTSPEAIFMLDRFQFLEWHTASTLPDGFLAVHAIRGLSGAGATVTLEQK